MKNTTQKQANRRRHSNPPASLIPGADPALVAHVLNTLPDSLSRREEVLQALAAIIPPDGESAARVRTLQYHLEEHRRLRLEWAEADLG
jgi:hypothetical protein